MLNEEERAIVEEILPILEREHYIHSAVVFYKEWLGEVSDGTYMTYINMLKKEYQHKLDKIASNNFNMELDDILKDINCQ